MDRKSEPMNNELLKEILLAYVQELQLIDSKIHDLTSKVLEQQAELIELQKEREETLKLKRDLMKEING